MSRVWNPVVYQSMNLLFLEEMLDKLRARVGGTDVLFRVSEREKLDRILRYGTDRGGYPGRKPWRHASAPDRDWLHEDIVFATSERRIRLAERDPKSSSSLKKIPGIDRPLLLIYDAKRLEPVREREYRFLHPRRKLDSLIAVIPVQKLAPIDGWFSEAEGVFYRSLAGSVRRGTVVEVGVWKGRSTAFVGPVCMANRNRLVCVDSWRGSHDRYDACYRRMLAEQDVRAVFRANMAARRISVVEMPRPSVEAAGSFPPAGVQLVFLDGSHDRDSVSEDARVWYERVAAGGILAGHDYNDGHPEVIEAVDRFAGGKGLAVRRGPGSIWYLEKPRS